MGGGGAVARRALIGRRAGSGAERGGHDCAQLRAAARPLLRLLGARGRRRPLVRAQGAQPRGDHHHAGHHRRVLLSLLADRHPGAGQPAVRTAAEERDRLVRALPLGVSPAPQRRASRRHREWAGMADVSPKPAGGSCFGLWGRGVLSPAWRCCIQAGPRQAEHPHLSSLWAQLGANVSFSSSPSSCHCSSISPPIPGSPRRCWARGWTHSPSAS